MSLPSISPWKLRTYARRQAARTGRNRRRKVSLEQLEARLALAGWNWTGAVDANWATAGNWALVSGVDAGGDNIPDPGDDLAFVSGAANLSTNNNFAAGTAFNSIAINAGGYMLAGNSVVINDSLTANFSSGTSTISLSLGSDANGMTLTKTGTGTTVGVLSLTGNNTYAGPTNLNHGEISIATATALGATGPGNETFVTGSNGTTGSVLRLNPGAAINVAETLHLNANSAGRFALINAAQANTISGNIDVSSTGNLGQFTSSGGSLTITGDVSGTMTGGSLLFLRGTSTSAANHLQGDVNLVGGNLAKTDTGLWVVGTAGNTYSWANTVVAVGTLRMNVANIMPAAGTLSMNQSSGSTSFTARLELNGFSQTVAGITIPATSGTGSSTIDTGAGTLTINGDVNTTSGNATLAFTGNFNLGGGNRTFNIINGSAGNDATISGNISNGTLTKTGAGNLTYGGAGGLGLNLTQVNVNVGQFTHVGGGATYIVGGGTGKTNVASGATFQSNTGALINSDLDIAAGGTARFTVNTTPSVASLSGGGNLILGGTGAIPFTVGANNLSTTFSGTIVEEAGAVGSLTKVGTGVLTLSGAAANTYTGTTTVNVGRLHLNKTAGVNAVGGDLAINNGAQVTFGASQQIIDSSNVTVSGVGSAFNGTGPNVGHLNFAEETIGSLTVTGGAFTVGASVWTITGTASFTGGVGNTVVVANSGSTLIAGGLSLTDMTVTAGANTGAANSFTLYGNSTTLTSSITVGAGGLALNNSVLNMRRGGTGGQGSRLILNGDITVTGGNSSIIEDTAGGTVGAFAIELSSTAGAVTRTINAGPNLAINVPITNGASAQAGITKLGTGTLTFSGGLANTYTGLTTLDGGLLALNKGANVTSIPGDLNIINGGRVTFGNNQQLASTSNVSVSGLGSTFNGTAANAGQRTNHTETIASLTLTGGSFSPGIGSTWNITGAGSFTGGAENTNVVGSSGSTMNFGSLSITDMTAVAGGDPATNNSFTLFGNNATIQSSITVGSGGLTLNNARLNLRRGNAGAQGSRLTLNGDVSTTGSLASFITEDTAGGTGGTMDLQLSGFAGPATRTFNVAGGGANLTIDVPITDGAATPGSLTKTGAGTLFLTGTMANTYTGLTAVNQGTLSLGKTAGVNAIGGDALLGGGNLALAAANQIPDTASVTVNAGQMLTAANPETLTNITLNAAGQISTISNMTVTDTTTVTAGQHDVGSGSTLTTNALVISGGGNLRMGSNSNNTTINVGPGGLTMNGGTIEFGQPGNAGRTGTLNLNGDFTGSGTNLLDVRTSPGVVNLGGATRTFNITGGTTTIEGAIVGSAGFIKTGGGTLALTGATANTYGGLTTVSGGTLTLGKTDGITAVPGDILVTGGTLTKTTAEQIAATSSIVMNGGVFLTGNNAETVANVTLNNTAQNVLSALTVTGLLNITTGTLHDVGSNQSLTANAMQMSGGSIIRMGANSGGTTMNIGPGGLTMNGATIGFGQLGNAAHTATLNLFGDFTGSGTNLFDLRNAQAVLNLGTTTRTFNVTGGTTTVEVPISGTSGFLKTGSGVLELTNNNTYSGATTVNGGTLLVSGGNAIPNTSPVSLGAGAILNLNNSSETIGDLSGAGGAQVQMGSGTLTVNQTGTTTYSGVINGTGQFVKNGGGTLVIGAGGQSTGGVVVNGGILRLSAPGVAFDAGVFPGNQSIAVNSGAQLDINQIWNASTTNVITATGGNVNISAGSATDGVNYINNLNLNNATVTGNPFRIGNTTNAVFNVGGSGPSTISAVMFLVNNVDISGVRTLTINVADAAAGDDLIVASAIRDLGQNGTSPNLRGTDLIKTGAGTMTINAAATMTGDVTVSGGTMRLNAAGVGFDAGLFPGNPITVAAGATLDVARDWNVSSNNLVTVSGGTVNISAGTIVDGVNYINRLNLNGGLVSGNPFRVGNTSNGVFNIGGTTPSTISATMFLTNDVDITGVRTLTINVADVAAGADLSITAPIRDLGQNGTSPFRRGTDLIKNGAGTLVLSGASTYTGDTLINAGTLSGTASLVSAVTIADGATLAPGGAPGTFATGPTVLQSGANFDVDLLSSGSDRLNVTGNVNVSGAVLNLSGDAVSTGDPIILIAPTGTITGAFAGRPEGSDVIFNGSLYRITYGDPSGIFDVGNVVALVPNRSVTAVDDDFGPTRTGAPFSGDVSENDLDPDGDGVYSLDTNAAQGNVVMNADGTFTYTPTNISFVGTDSFTYRLADSEFSSTATVTIEFSRIFLDDNGSLVVVGTAGTDRIIVQQGGAGLSIRMNNVLYSGFGAVAKVVVYAGGGNDTVTVSNVPVPVEFYGEAGNDYLAGGRVNDLIDGGEGNDRLFGGIGDDVLLGGSGNDRLSGGTGNDYAMGGGQVDNDNGEMLELDQLPDPIFVSQASSGGRNTVNGDAGDDVLIGGNENDTLNGGAGNDLIRGGDGNDRLDGGAGDDVLSGEVGSDLLYGRNGNDILIGGDGNDNFYGGGGNDLLIAGILDEMLAEDHETLLDLLAMWSAGLDEDVADEFESNVEDDGVFDTMHGEGGADWYLMFSATGDRFRLASESRSPNVTRDPTLDP